jgi:hypothetical protein
MRNTHRFFGDFSSFVLLEANSVGDAQSRNLAEKVAICMVLGRRDGTPTGRADCRRRRLGQ